MPERAPAAPRGARAAGAGVGVLASHLGSLGSTALVILRSAYALSVENVAWKINRGHNV